MAAKMTPREFADKYLNLDLYLFPQELNAKQKALSSYTPPTGWQVFKADNYRLGLSSWPQTFWHENILPQIGKTGIKVKVKTINDVHLDYQMSALQAWGKFVHPFYGKGSPEDIQLALQLIYRYRPAKTPIDQFLSLDFVGLDCNGFVGSYYQRVVLDNRWLSANPSKDPGPNSMMEPILKWGTELQELSDIKGEGTYILVWCDAAGIIKEPNPKVKNSYGHVMITEPNTLKGSAGSQTVTVVEATASGKRKLRVVDYVLQSVSKVKVYGKPVSVFTVLRGPDKDVMTVRMSRLEV